MAKTPHSTTVRSQKATTVTGLLADLPPERSRELAVVRTAIRHHLPKGYEETVVNGMIVYQVPLSRYADTYNGQPLWLAALASPKSYLALHLMPVYRNPPLMAELERGFAAAGKRLDIGKACLHFRRADDLALDAIGRIIGSMPVDKWIAVAEAAWRR